MEVIETDEEEVQLMNEGLSLIKAAGAIIITNDEQHLAAGAIYKQLTAYLKGLDNWFDPMIADANKSHKGLTSRKRETKAKPMEVCDKLGAGMGEYVTRKEQLRAAELEKARKEHEAKQAELKLEAALQAEEAGEPELAEALLEQPTPKAQSVIPATPKQDGISYRKVWSHEVFDLMSLVTAVAVGEVSINAIEANDVFLKGQAKTLKKDFEIPGVKVHCDDVPVLRQ